MFTYKEIEKSCKRLGIDTEKRGKNPFALAKTIYAKDKSANLKELGFPEKEKVQIEKIGKLINNLFSQLTFPRSFNLTTEEGKLEKEMDDKISKFLPTACLSQKEWLQSGAQKASLNVSDFSLDSGIVYELDKEKVKAMKDMHDSGPRYVRLNRGGHNRRFGG